MLKRLIIIDDEEYIRIPIQDFFEDNGWQVNPFNSAEEALEYLKTDTAECIIVDMRLPGMTGLEFIDKANSIRRGLKYVIYTGSVDFNITENLRSIGITEECVVHKPAENLSELLNAAEFKPGCGG
ncbi:MAG TPA: response regulator [Spirochaetota bacterium]|nr:response regulator [Spirochaetota bacterium]HPR36992.1 response regulator [Spirochaetota bacterium]